MAQIGVDGLPLNGFGDMARTHAVIRFKRAVSFPRFSMGCGERWSFVVYGKTSRMLEAIRSEDRFEFAGGTGLSADVEIVYEGPADGAVEAAVSLDMPKGIGLAMR
jgi:hypothetical protein